MTMQSAYFLIGIATGLAIVGIAIYAWALSPNDADYPHENLPEDYE